jgi:macrolide-specific efflux system membrane fusion protein
VSKLQWVTVVLVVLSAGVAGVFYGKSRGGEQPTYRKAVVERGEIQRTILATGLVQPENRLEIKPPIAGRVEEVMVQEGDKIKKGQILVRMSSTERAALLDSARSKGMAEYNRWKEMFLPTPIMAPIDGTLIHRNVEPGQSFTSADAILVMSDRLTVKGQVDETDIGQIKVGQEAEIVLDAYSNEKFAAKVDQVAFEAKTVNNVTTYVVDVLPEKNIDFMRSGMTANVTFFVERKDGVLVIPSDAVKIKDGKSTVLVATDDGEPQVQEVSVGITDGKRTEITEGLEQGATILIPQTGHKGARSRAFNPLAPGGTRPRSGRGK